MHSMLMKKRNLRNRLLRDTIKIALTLYGTILLFNYNQI